MDCIFCLIAAKQIPADILFEDDKIIAFRDIHPQAPFHAVVIPKTHLASANEITGENAGLIAHIFTKIAEIAKSETLCAEGYRVITNCGKNAGQTVFHLHFHLLAGKPFTGRMV